MTLSGQSIIMFINNIIFSLQLAKAIYFMKVGIKVYMDVDTFLDRLNIGLCNCYRDTTHSQVCS